MSRFCFPRKGSQVFSLPFLLLAISTRHSFAQEKVQDQVEVKFENVDFHESCYNLHHLIGTPQYERDTGKPFLEEKLIINDAEDYRNFQNTISNARNLSCKSVEFPSIDFSQKTLLGNWGQGSCAARSFEKVVLRDDSKKKVVYSVKVVNANIGACSGPGLNSLNFIAIPKIPENYKVVFSPPPSDHGDYQQSGCSDGKMITRDWNGNIVNPRNSPPAGGGIFGLQMDCDGTMLEKMTMAEKKLLIDSGAMNIPPPCPEGTTLGGAYCVKISTRSDNSK